MTDEHPLSGYSGHTHAFSHTITPVIALDGILVTVSVDRDGVLWTGDLTGGPCVQRPLELERAGPEDEWYYEVGEWYEDDDEDPGDGELRPRVEVDPADLAVQLTVAHLDGRPVVLTGRARFDLSHPDFEAAGGAVRVWDLATGRKVGPTITGHELGVTALTTVAGGPGPDRRQQLRGGMAGGTEPEPGRGRRSRGFRAVSTAAWERVWSRAGPWR